MRLIVLVVQKVASLSDQSDQIINFNVGFSDCFFCADSSCIPSIVEFRKKVSYMPIVLFIALVCFYYFFNIVVLFIFFLLLSRFFLCILMLTAAYCCTVLSYQCETVEILIVSISYIRILPSILISYVFHDSCKVATLPFDYLLKSVMNWTLANEHLLMLLCTILIFLFVVSSFLITWCYFPFKFRFQLFVVINIVRRLDLTFCSITCIYNVFFLIIASCSCALGMVQSLLVPSCLSLQLNVIQ